MDALIVAGSALVTGLVVVAIAMVVAGSRADRAQRDLSGAPARQADGKTAPARRFRRMARPRSSARR
jgi:hypothetical protein